MFGPIRTKPIDYTYLQQWFGRDRFADQSYYGGDRENNRDHYDLISYGGHDFIIVYFRLAANTGIL